MGAVQVDNTIAWGFHLSESCKCLTQKASGTRKHATLLIPFRTNKNCIYIQ